MSKRQLFLIATAAGRPTRADGTGEAGLNRSADGLWGAIRNWMEPNRVSIRLFGDVRTDDAEVTEVQVQV